MYMSVDLVSSNKIRTDPSNMNYFNSKTVLNLSFVLTLGYPKR